MNKFRANIERIVYWFIGGLSGVALMLLFHAVI